jgi:hypothetical protein
MSADKSMKMSISIENVSINQMTVGRYQTEQGRGQRVTQLDLEAGDSYRKPGTDRAELSTITVSEDHYAVIGGASHYLRIYPDGRVTVQIEWNGDPVYDSNNCNICGNPHRTETCGNPNYG